ncbi:TlpA disulfide reductase family protein [Rhodococcus sp. IEGM 1379]|uniref:TlpA family protein disulfide reductase n=1 Tax=Rhodococcus sp. IEGM 1379 TaxID=3047086 RepID=UPI0024B73D15|nr:TlpA disulfide reductase family protein [Rhodococcus sp. IEGM 1379]MDI9918237.1 TlpA disulfide reductase family protein [Rhodococcus sp. IEGM 1379]
MSSAARWSLVALALVAALVVAIWPRGGDDAPNVSSGSSTSAYRPPTFTPSSESLGQLREQAGLAACPTPVAPAPAGAALTGITLACIADGSSVDLAAAVAGKPTLVNLWAYWCAPCAEELPHLQEFADRAGQSVNVLTVHSDPNQENALTRLIDYSVRLPGVQDGDGKVRIALGAPPVLPVSVLIRPDGTVAKVLPQPFRSADEIAAATAQYLGVVV